MTVGNIQTICRRVKVRELSKPGNDICLLSVSIGDDFHSLSLRLMETHPIHPYILEKIRELLVALFACSLEDVDRVLNSEIVEVALCDKLEDESFTNEKETSNIDKNEENR